MKTSFLDWIMYGNRVVLDLNGRFSSYPDALKKFILECNEKEIDFSRELARWGARLVVPANLEFSPSIVFDNEKCYNRFNATYSTEK